MVIVIGDWESDVLRMLVDCESKPGDRDTVTKVSVY